MKKKNTKQSHSPIISLLRRFRLSATLSAVVYLILGLVLLFAPQTSRAVLGSVIGIGITLYGALSMISFLLNRGEKAYIFELLIGICAAGFGLFLLLKPTFLTNFLYIILGLVGVIGSISAIKRVIHLRSLGYPRWFVPLIPNAVALLISLSVIFKPGFYGDLMMIIIGLILIAESVSDLFTLRNLSVLARVLE